jgi:DNA-directed RNA polymerase specialized sigma24 family protein
LNDWINQNYKEMLRICHKVTKTDDIDDLFQICVEDFIRNKKVKDIPDEQKLYFFTRIVKNNYNSTKSKYHYQYRKFKWEDVDDVEIVDEEYEETEFNLEWVKNEIENIKLDEWYYGRLFELYLEEGASLTKLSKRTTIPINSVSRDINRVRTILKNKRKKIQQRGM